MKPVSGKVDMIHWRHRLSHSLSSRLPSVFRTKDHEIGRLGQDLDIAHRRRWPGRSISFISCLVLLASSAGLRLLLIHRLSHWLRLKRNNSGKNEWLLRIMLIPFELLKLAVKINAKSDIGNDCEIEGGVSFSDQGHIVFGALKTGAGTVIGNRVTLGKSHVDNGKPEIGRNVWMGSDCIVYGGIRIGDGATLLPGTVLTKNIPAGVVMQGNPARLVLRNFDNSVLRERRDADALRYVNSVRFGNGAQRSSGIVLSASVDRQEQSGTDNSVLQQQSNVDAMH